MRFSKYNYVIKKEDSIKIYNANTDTVINIDNKKDLSNIETMLDTGKILARTKLAKALYKLGYIVDDNIDEYALAKQRVEKHYSDLETLYIHLYVTNQCNFRCIYCPEEHISEVFSPESWNALYKFISKKLKNESFKKVSISFYGGEPLLEFKAIKAFLKKLNKLSEKYPELTLSHIMTTNAYLLTPKVYDELVSLNVNTYQVTIDGLAETHDKTRPLANGKGSWAKIIENFEYINLQYDDTLIYIRGNVNPENAQSIEGFYEWFDDYLLNRKFCYYIHPVAPFSSLVKSEYVMSNDHAFRDLEIKLRDSYKRYISNRWSDLSFLGQVCKCANPNFYAITVDNRVLKCEQDYGDRADCVIGYLDTQKADIVITKDISCWESYETEECETCSVYPLCAGRKCPASKIKNLNPRKDCLLVKDKYKHFIEDNVPYAKVVDLNSIL